MVGSRTRDLGAITTLVALLGGAAGLTPTHVTAQEGHVTAQEGQEAEVVQQNRTIVIPRVATPPAFDWFFDNGNAHSESSGSSSPDPSLGIEVTDFRQREPGDGDPVSQPTTAYLSYDQENLYIVFIARDEPGRVRANIARRESIGDDDQVLVYLDTFNDDQRAYRFAANPYGVQADGIVTEGGDDDSTFDQVWTSEGRLTEEGYIVRMAIPFRSLRFPRRSEQTWGIALGRKIRRNNEESYWPHITEEISNLVPQFGTLEGLAEVSPGRNIQINPYYTRARAREFDDDIPGHVDVNDLRVGVDAKMVVQDAVTLDATLDPDFSQVESDDPQVTANERFETFFPEKRPFFLENAGFFQTPENLFHSRRIVDPDVGLRATGKLGRWAFGGLVTNDRANDHLDADDPLSGRGTWVGVLRVQREFGEESSVGILATDREYDGLGLFDRVVSADARFRLGDNWELEGQLIRSTRQEAARERPVSGWAGLTQVGFETRNLGIGGEYTEFSPDFDAPLGFVRRVGYRTTQADVEYTFRPDDLFVTEFGPSVSAEFLWDHETGNLLDRELEFSFGMELLGDSEIEYTRKAIFEWFEGLRFHPWENEVVLGSEWLKWLFFESSYIWGSVVNHDPADDLEPSLMNFGERSAQLTLLPTTWLNVGLEYEDLSLHTRDGASSEVLTERQLRAKINYQYNRELSLRAIFDYDLLDADDSLVDEDPRERELGVDLLLTYLVSPGTAVHLGYIDQYENLSIVRDDEGELDVINSRSATDMSVGRQLFLKISYLWRP